MVINLVKWSRFGRSRVSVLGNFFMLLYFDVSTDNFKKSARIKFRL